MNRDSALEYLRSRQPMRPDRDLTSEEAAFFDEVRKYFLEHPDPECIPLFLNSFGEGDGFGVYPLVQDVITIFSRDDVIPHLRKGLENPQDSVRYWCAQIAAVFPDESLIPPLAIILCDGGHDQKYAALTALEQIGGDEVKKILREALEREKDEAIIQLIKEIQGSLLG